MAIRGNVFTSQYILIQDNIHKRRGLVVNTFWGDKPNERGIPPHGGNNELPINLYCMQEGKCKNGSKWPTNNHVSGLTLSRQCVHTLRCAENKHSTPTHKEKWQTLYLEPCQFVLKCLCFRTPTDEHGNHAKEGTTKGEREMTEMACSRQHGKWTGEHILQQSPRR